MIKPSDFRKLKKMHHPEQIKKRLQEIRKNSYLGDAVLGGIDGCITTFAIVTATVGGGFPPLVALALGLSNLVADGLSMAVSNFQATSSLSSRVQLLRQEEGRHIEIIPEGEKEEIRQIFAQKGFAGDLLEQIVETITANKELWIDTMIQEEHGLPLNPPNPYMAAWVTFASFCLVGLMPILPFFYLQAHVKFSFVISCFLTAGSFLIIGAIKALLIKASILRGALSVLCLGGVAALLAYGISAFVSQLYPLSVVF